MRGVADQNGAPGGSRSRRASTSRRQEREPAGSAGHDLDELLGWAVSDAPPAHSDEPDEPIIWMRPEVTGRGRTPSFNREQIARAAVTIADTEGVEAVSMRRVAAAIGAGTMSLYRYVRTKDDLYALMVDAVLDDNEPPGQLSDDWSEVLRELGRTTRQLVLRHPWFPVLQAGLVAPSPRMVRGLEAMMAAIDGLGLGVDEMLEIIMTVMTFALGAAQEETVAARVMLRQGLDPQQWQQRQAPYMMSLIATGQFPYLKRIVTDAEAPHRGSEAIFERSLDRLITGIAATLPPTPVHPPPR